MKKIALVTCYFQHNYGSQLQAWATQRICDQLNWPNETIRIDGLKKEINRAKYKYFLSRIWDIHTILDKMATIRKKLAQKCNKEYAKNLSVRDGLFDKFAREEFRLSIQYDSKTEIGNHAADYSAFIVGSDQLWLPSNISADYYTLNFVANGIGVKKVAYATSFGVSKLPTRQAKMASKFLPSFDSIMVRESTGQKLIKQITGIDVPVVCDPTLLFSAEEWSEFVPKTRRITEPYILCYFLGNNPEHRQWAKKLSNETGHKIVQLPHLDEYVKSDNGFADYPLYDVNALEFVSLIRDAEYVLTDSFHCSVFSILHQKKFFCFRRYANDNITSTNGRLYSLLAMLELSDRMLTGTEDIQEALANQIHTENTLLIVEKMRQESIRLLKNAIKTN